MPLHPRGAPPTPGRRCHRSPQAQLAPARHGVTAGGNGRPLATGHRREPRSRADGRAGSSDGRPAP